MKPRPPFLGTVPQRAHGTAGEHLLPLLEFELCAPGSCRKGPHSVFRVAWKQRPKQKVSPFDPPDSCSPSTPGCSGWEGGTVTGCSEPSSHADMTPLPTETCHGYAPAALSTTVPQEVLSKCFAECMCHSMHGDRNLEIANIRGRKRETRERARTRRRSTCVDQSPRRGLGAYDALLEVLLPPQV